MGLKDRYDFEKERTGHPEGFNVGAFEKIVAEKDTELTTLRQRLAEAEADLKQMSQHADAWKEAFDREWNRAEKAEAEKSRLVSAMTKENERVAADAARWEGAAREIASMPMPDHLSETMARELLREAITTASALVREGGGGA